MFNHKNEINNIENNNSDSENKNNDNSDYVSNSETETLSETILDTEMTNENNDVNLSINNIPQEVLLISFQEIFEQLNKVYIDILI